MPSRLDELARWFRLSLDLGYKFYSVAQYWRLTDGGRTAPLAKSIVLRHDVDLDVATAAAMFTLEKELSIAGSYYFRLGTIDFPLMQTIAGSDAEVSYHYEELATEAKTSCLRSTDEVETRLPIIRQRFLQNLHEVRAATGLSMTTVSSHGDWVNRKLGVANTDILKCPEVRQRAGVEVEAYDRALMKFVTARYADAMCPTWWIGKLVAQVEPDRLEFLDGAPRTPTEAVRAGLPVLYVLLHPEQWRSRPFPHLKQQVTRVKETVAYKLRIKLKSYSVPQATAARTNMAPAGNFGLRLKN
jgi:hypothetical protein